MQQNQSGRIIASSPAKKVKFKRPLEETIFIRNQYKQYQGRAMLMTISKCLQKKKFLGFMKLCINVRQFQQKRMIVKLVALFINKKDKVHKNHALAKIRKKAFQFNYAIAMAKKLYFLEKSKKLQFKRLFFSKMEESMFRQQFRCKFPNHRLKNQLFRSQDRQITNPAQIFETSLRQNLSQSGYRPTKKFHATQKLYSPVVRLNTQDQDYNYNKQKQNVKMVQFSTQFKDQLINYQKYNKQKLLSYITEELKLIIGEQVKKVDRLKIINKMFREKPRQDQLLLRILNNAIKLICQLNKQKDDQDDGRRSVRSSVSNSLIIERTISSNTHTASMTNLQLLSRNRGMSVNKQPREKQFQTMKKNIRKQLQSNNTLYAKNHIKMFLKKFSDDQKFKDQLLVYECLHNFLVENQKINKCLDQSKKIVEKFSTVDLEKPISANLQTLKGVKRQCSLVMNKNAKNAQQDALSNKVYQIAKNHEKNAQDYITLLKKTNQNGSSNFVRSRQASPISALHKKFNSQTSVIQDGLKIKQLQKQLKEANENYDNSLFRLQNLQKQVNAIKIQRTQKQQILHEKQRKIVDLQAQITIQRSNKMQNVINSLNQKLETQKQQLQEKQRVIRTLQQKNRDMSEKIKRIDNLFEKRQSQIYSLEQKEMSMREEILQIKIELNRQRNQKQELQQQLELLNSKKDQLVESQAKQRSKIQQLNEKIKQMMQTNDRLSEIVAQQCQRYAGLQLKYKQLEKEYKEKLSKDSDNFFDVINFQNSISNKQESIDSRTYDQTKRNQDEISFQNKYLTQMLQKQRKYAQKLKSQNGLLQRQVADLRRNLETNSKFHIGQTGYSEQERQIMKSTLNQYSVLKDRLNQTEQNLESANNKIKKYGQQIRAQEIHAGKLIIENHKLNDQLDHVKKQFEQIKHSYKIISEDLSHWKHQHQLIVEQQVRKALKIQQIQVNQFLKRNDLQRNAFYENIVIPQQKREWEKEIKGWVDGIVKQQQKFWQLQFKKKYQIN